MAASNPFDSRTMLDGIRRWVEIETPTEAPEQVNRLVTMVADGYRDLPATIERIPGRDGRGDHLIARSDWGQSEPGILVLSHLDTVHPLGFIERLPFRIEGDSAFGPGIYDMKGGAYLAWHAFAQLCAAGERIPLGITHLYVSDEEIGSPTSRALIEAEGHKAKYVLVTEPARDGGKIVTGRKGVARFEVFVQRRARACRLAAAGWPQRHPRTRQCHPGAGGDDRPQARRHRQCRRHQGRHQTQRHCRKKPMPRSTFACMTIADADEFVAKILNLKSRSEGVTVKVTGELNRPPYEKGNAGAALYEHAKTLAAEIGFDLVDTFTGGGSDGNFTAPFTATLDGLGVDGEGAHTHYEQLYISSIEPRARLLHRLYQTLR